MVYTQHDMIIARPTWVWTLFPCPLLADPLAPFPPNADLMSSDHDPKRLWDFHRSQDAKSSSNSSRKSKKSKTQVVEEEEEADAEVGSEGSGESLGGPAHWR